MNDKKEAIQRLHQSPWRLVAACTGAGLGLADALWQEPGSSNTLLETVIPYSRSALIDLIGQEPEKFVSDQTARMMAAAAFSRAQELAVRDNLPNDHLLGVGLTAAVATDRPKRGEHRLHLAVRTANRLYELDFIFEKGKRTREEEGRVCVELALDLIMLTAGLGEVIEEPYLFGPMDRLVVFPTNLPTVNFTENHQAGFPNGLVIWPEGRLGRVDAAESLDPKRHVLFPGSFNPVHYGHERVAAAARQLTGKTVVFHLTATHPVKGRVAPEELSRRAGQFSHRHPVLLTDRDGLYVEKCRLFPEFDILIGADAALALLNPKYYGGSEAARDAMLDEIALLGNRFLVSGRVVDGQYLDPTRLPIPDGYHRLFVPVSGGSDISSTQLRNRKTNS